MQSATRVPVHVASPFSTRMQGPELQRRLIAAAALGGFLRHSQLAPAPLRSSFKYTAGFLN
jgi:hypothetical protein